MARKLPPYHYKHVCLLKLSPFERAPRGGWRFGTRRISDGVADSLIASGRAEIQGDKLMRLASLNTSQRPEPK